MSDSIFSKPYVTKESRDRFDRIFKKKKKKKKKKSVFEYKEMKSCFKPIEFVKMADE